MVEKSKLLSVGRADRRTFLKVGLGAAAGALASSAAGATADEPKSTRPAPRNWSKGKNTQEHRAWLKQVVEEPLEPELPICDPHHHMGDWPSFFRYLMADLLDDARGLNLVDTVFVECRAGYRQDGPVELRPVGETEFMEGIARKSLADPKCPTAVAAAIVGHADLRLGEGVAPVLQAHLAASLRFRGIRHACAWHPSPAVGQSYMGSPPGLLGDSEFRKGIACLNKLGLSYDSWAYMNQLGELADLARAFPELTIVCDHVGGVVGLGPYAGRREEAFAEWKRGMKELASCLNVSMKLGGLAMPLSGFGWQDRDLPPTSFEMAEATAPYYLECIEAFGPERCMFESNFPVEKLSCSYRVLWNSFKRIAKAFSPDEKAALFHDTAARVYLIGTAQHV